MVLEEEHMVLLRQLLTFSAIALSIIIPGFAQSKEKIKQLTPSGNGSTGLFNLYVADTLRQGELSLGLTSTHFNREPGDLDFTLFPVSITIGLHDRIEFFLSWEAHRQVNADAIRVDKIAPGDPIVPARLNNSDGSVAFFNDAPFLDVGFGQGSGELWTGFKFNLLSEVRGGPLGLAIQPRIKFPLSESRTRLLQGLTNGAIEVGYDLILSKDLPRAGTFTANFGYLFVGDSQDLNLQHRLHYGIGYEMPVGTEAVRTIGELVGSLFFGEGVPGANPKSPLDLYFGLQISPLKWISISAAYNINLRSINPDLPTFNIQSTDRSGWFLQVAFHRKINRPPTIRCNPNPALIAEGDSATIRALIADPDDSFLTLTWSSSSGRISQQGTTIVFDSTGLTAGRYTVRAEVGDGDHTASCSTDIIVEKRKMAPTVVCEPAHLRLREGESVTLRTRASDPNNDLLTYYWTVDSQSVLNNEPDLVFGTPGRAIGAHTVRVTATDVDRMRSDCQFSITIERRPNRSPTISLTLDKSEVYAGATISAKVRARDPDGDPLTYSWSIDGRRHPELGSEIQIHTGGMASGSHRVHVRVTDDRNAHTEAMTSFTVSEKIVIQIDQTRPDDEEKLTLDEIAVKMQKDPALRATVTGHTDALGSEELNERVGLQRAEAVREYLVEEHAIGANRIEIRSAGETRPTAENETPEGRRQNRRVEIELVVQ